MNDDVVRHSVDVGKNDADSGLDSMPEAYFEHGRHGRQLRAAKLHNKIYIKAPHRAKHLRTYVRTITCVITFVWGQILAHKRAEPMESLLVK